MVRSIVLENCNVLKKKKTVTFASHLTSVTLLCLTVVGVRHKEVLFLHISKLYGKKLLSARFNMKDSFQTSHFWKAVMRMETTEKLCKDSPSWAI